MEQKSIRKQHSENEGVTNVIQGRGEELGRLRESNELKLRIQTSSRNSDRNQDACKALKKHQPGFQQGVLYNGVHWEGVIHRNKETENKKPIFLYIAQAVFKYAVSLCIHKHKR